MRRLRAGIKFVYKVYMVYPCNNGLPRRPNVYTHTDNKNAASNIYCKIYFSMLYGLQGDFIFRSIVFTTIRVYRVSLGTFRYRILPKRGPSRWLVLISGIVIGTGKQMSEKLGIFT